MFKEIQILVSPTEKKEHPVNDKILLNVHLSIFFSTNKKESKFVLICYISVMVGLHFGVSISQWLWMERPRLLSR